MKISKLLGAAAVVSSAALLLPQSSLAAACSVNDVSLTIGSTVYAPTACADGVNQGGGPAVETSALGTQLGLAGLVYLDKSDDASTPAGIAGVTFQVTAPASGTQNSGNWSVSWNEAAGLPNLPLTIDFAVALFGGNLGSGYLFDNVLLPVSPNTGNGTFDINFTNNGGQQPALSHLLLASAGFSTPPCTGPGCGGGGGGSVPEPAPIALMGLALAGMAAFKRRRTRTL